MEAKEQISQLDIINAYMDYISIHNEQPKSINIFASNNKIEEQKFYEFFTSFDTLEQSTFKIFFDETYAILEKSKDYIKYNPNQKLLNFYYTFFQILTHNRDYVIYVLNRHQSSLKSFKTLEYLQNRFSNYIASLNIKSTDLNKSAWLQLITTIRFWLNDTSPSCEKTEAFIEESVKASFNTVDAIPLKSALHISKFLYKERIQAS